MHCPYCKEAPMMDVKKYDYHHLGKIKSEQPVTTIVSTLYECSECKTTVETTEQVRVVSPKEG